MIDDFKKIVEKGIREKNVRAFRESVEGLLDKYPVSEKTLYNRFKSTFKMCPKDYIFKHIYPTKEQFSKYVLSSSSSEEVKEKSGLSNKDFVGIYDKFYGVSTFQKARLVLLNMHTHIKVPQREDNRAIIYSQVLGDGSYDKKRHALRIIHGEKQAEYLRWKVDLLNSAYPKTSKEVKQRIHKQGHIYFDYYTAIGNVDVPSTEAECVSLLTNLGWLLWWLDDGCYSQNISIACRRSKEVRDEAIHELSTYGIKARQDSDGILMCGQENDLLFYKNFIEPFMDDIPKCMMYKVEDIVGRVCI